MRNQNKTLALAGLALLGAISWSISAVEAPPATQPAAADVSMSVELPAGGKPGGITFTNRSTVPLLVLIPIDGCDMGWRVVSYKWTITDDKGQPAKINPGARCGNTNPLRVEDFVEIAPGKSATIGWEFLGDPDSGIQAPGEYSATLTYSFANKPARDGLSGPDARGTAELLARAWTGTIVSDPVKFTVAAAPAGKQ